MDQSLTPLFTDLAAAQQKQAAANSALQNATVSAGAALSAVATALGVAGNELAKVMDAVVLAATSDTTVYALTEKIRATADPLVKAPVVVVPPVVVPPVVDPLSVPLGSTALWKTDIVRDFRNAKTVALGAAKSALAPMVFYDGTSFRDTDKDGLYDTAKTVSVVGSTTGSGYLDVWMRHISGQPYGAAVLPMGWAARSFGRFSIRFFVEPVKDRKVACFLWPEPSTGFPEGDWKRGEADFLEGSLDGNIEAYLHSTAGDPNINAAWAKPGVKMAGGWHTATCEWTAAAIVYFLDGVEILRAKNTDNGYPKFPMRWIIQFESEIEAGVPAVAEGHIKVAWLTVHSVAA